MERFLADAHWIQYLIQIFQAKDYTWSTTIDRVDNEKEKEDLLEDFYSKGTDVKDDHTRLVEEADVYEMDGEDFEKLIKKQMKRVATLEDAAKIEKYRVQRFFRGKINAKDVEEFDKKIQAAHIHTRILQGVPAHREETDRLEPSAHAPVAR